MHRVPTAVLTQSKPVSNTAVRPVSAVLPSITVTCPRHANQVVTKSKSPIRRQLTHNRSSRTSNSPLRVNETYPIYLTLRSLMEDMLPLEVTPRVVRLLLSDESQVMLRVPRENNMYNVNLKNVVPSGDLTFLFAKATLDESNLWHKRLAHVNFKTINRLVKENLVRGLPTKVFENDHTCVAFKKGKQHKASCKTKPVSSIDQPLFRLHMNLFGPTFVKNLNKKSYCLVITDDYSRFTWVFFLATKDETTPIIKTFLTGLENQLSLKVKVIRSDNGTEFKNFDHNQFCRLKGIKREFSVPRTPQQNGIAERKNKTLIKAVRTMLADSLLPIPFWAEAVNTACYVQNRVLLTKPHNKTLYELLHGRLPSIGFMRPFGCPVTILNTLDPLDKFQGKVDEGFLVGYSVCTGPTWLFDIDSLSGTMNYHPVAARNQTNSGAGFQDNLDAKKTGKEVDQSYMLFPMWSSVGFTNPQNNAEDAAFDGKEHDFDVKKLESKVILSLSSSAPSKEQDDKTIKEAKGKSHVDSVTGYRDLNAEFQDCSENSSNEVTTASSTVPTVGPTYGDASQFPDDPDMPGLKDIIYSDDEDVVGIEADFNNLESSIPVSPIPTKRIHKDHPVSQIIGDLCSTTQTRSMTRAVKDQVDMPYGKRAIGTKWVYMNKKDEREIVIRNKARLVAQGHTQEEGINYEEVFSPVAKIEAIRLFLAYASFMGFMVYQMDVKSAFLYETIKEDLYVCQPLGFEDPDHPDKVYKVVKALYGLHQAPIKQKKDGIFISQDKYVPEILKKFRLTEGKSASTPIDTKKPLLKDPDGKDVDVHTYRSMIGSLMYLTSSRPDIMFACKKQTVVATSSTEAEYVVAASCCAQAMNSTGDDQVKERQAKIYQINMDHPSKVLSMQEDEPAEVEEIVEVVTTAKLITKVVAVVSKDLEEESTAKTPAEAKSEDKGKGIMVEEPKPIKKKQQVEMDEEYARKLHKELNQYIDWDVAIDHVKQKAKEDPYVQRYQVIKKRPQTEAQARRNMIMYLKNVVGFRLDYFKGMSYDDIRLIFKANFNTNIEFLLKSKEQIEEEEIRAIESINETPAQKAAKRRKLNEEVAELNKHLEIMPNEDDDVFTEATPLARKVPVVDYSIIFLNNKPHYKIVKADGTHQLYISFLTLLKNFDRDDLESLWSIVKERFSTTKPDNFTDDFLLTTLRTMFEEADVKFKSGRIKGRSMVKQGLRAGSC
uniref:Integrase catalytic domain-containing protein n=1 Tax=Tanacetum cinerariifolium TaxID=118510 RepID=A0A6L2MCI5_TANCI|nr:hypothetical protein [Tanacetum cinerariifolium]